MMSLSRYFYIGIEQCEIKTKQTNKEEEVEKAEEEEEKEEKEEEEEEEEERPFKITLPFFGRFVTC